MLIVAWKFHLQLSLWYNIYVRMYMWVVAHSLELKVCHNDVTIT